MARKLIYMLRFILRWLPLLGFHWDFYCEIEQIRRDKALANWAMRKFKHFMSCTRMRLSIAQFMNKIGISFENILFSSYSLIKVQIFIQVVKKKQRGKKTWIIRFKLWVFALFFINWVFIYRVYNWSNLIKPTFQSELC